MFSFLATDTELLYFRTTATPGTWTSGIIFNRAMTDLEIKTAYENNADTNVFTDAEKTKLSTLGPHSQAEIVTTTYSTLNSDFGSPSQLKRVNNATGCTLTITAGHTNKEPCTFIQTGAGQITFTPDVGVTILSADGHLLTRVQYSSATLVPDSATADTYYLIGDITT